MSHCSRTLDDEEIEQKTYQKIMGFVENQEQILSRSLTSPNYYELNFLTLTTKISYYHLMKRDIRNEMTQIAQDVLSKQFDKIPHLGIPVGLLIVILFLKNYEGTEDIIRKCIQKLNKLDNYYPLISNFFILHPDAIPNPLSPTSSEILTPELSESFDESPKLLEELLLTEEDNSILLDVLASQHNISSDLEELGISNSIN